MLLHMDNEVRLRQEFSQIMGETGASFVDLSKVFEMIWDVFWTIYQIEHAEGLTSRFLTVSTANILCLCLASKHDVMKCYADDTLVYLSVS